MARLRDYLPYLAALLLILLVAYIVVSPKEMGRSALSLKAAASSSACNGSVELSAELKDDQGKRVPDALVTFYAGKEELDSLYTDNNGRVRAEFPLERSWCGRKVDFSAVFAGDGNLGGNSAVSSSMIRAPASLSLGIPAEADEGEEVALSARLTDTLGGNPLAGKSVSIGDLSGLTDLNGTLSVNLSFNGSGTYQIHAAFSGDGFTEPASADGTVIILPRMCEDGTLVGECSGAFFCSEDRELEADCSLCGCPGQLICSEWGCISEEQRVQRLIEKLKLSNVKIESDEAIGSGVIIGRNGTDSMILTNRHVVDADFAFTSNTHMEIFNQDNETARPARIYLAPNQLDLAIILVKKDIGPPADINYSLKPDIGAEVLAIGAPLGIPNSVTSGIISNYVTTNTSSGFEYEVMQTDAAVNPGNSGGGVYLSSSGKLVGILSFKLVIRGIGRDQLAEGLGFAIPVGIVDEYPLREWKIIAPG